MNLIWCRIERALEAPTPPTLAPLLRWSTAQVAARKWLAKTAGPKWQLASGGRRLVRAELHSSKCALNRE